MKLNSMKPAKIKSSLSPSEKFAESDARNRPTAQPRKPNTWSEILPTMSASAMAKTMPTSKRDVVSAAPFAAIMSCRITSAMLRTWSDVPPIAAARMVGVKMPMP